MDIYIIFHKEVVLNMMYSGLSLKPISIIGPEIIQCIDVLFAAGHIHVPPDTALFFLFQINR